MAASGLMMIMMLLGGGGNDLLDFVSSEAYWTAKGVEVTADSLLTELKQADVVDPSALIKQLGNSEYKVREEASRRLTAMGQAALPELREAAKSSDAEISARAGKIIHGLSSKARAHAVRRLMAIRTLGEQKHRQAIPTLRKLLKSRTMFEAEYALAAIAAIEGKPFRRPGASDRSMQSDLWLLPENCGAVGQVRMLPGKPIDIKEILKTLGPMFPDGDTEKAIGKVNAMIISAADRVGNVRIDGVTFGVADTVDDDTGHIALVVRGLYDPAAVREVLLEQRMVKSEVVGGTEILKLDNPTIILSLASNERLVFMVGPSEEEIPIAQTIAALKSGKGKLAGNKAMAGLIKSVDTTDAAWAVARVSEAYRKTEMLEPFNTVTLVGKRKAKGMDFTLHARGIDAEKIAATVEEFNKLMAEGHEEMARMANEMPAMRPIAEFIGSIKTVVAGTNVTVTAQLKGDMKTLLGMPWLILSGASSSEVHEAVVEEAGGPPPAP